MLLPWPTRTSSPCQPTRSVTYDAFSFLQSNPVSPPLIVLHCSCCYCSLSHYQRRRRVDEDDDDDGRAGVSGSSGQLKGNATGTLIVNSKAVCNRPGRQLLAQDKSAVAYQIRRQRLLLKLPWEPCWAANWGTVRWACNSITGVVKQFHSLLVSGSDSSYRKNLKEFCNCIPSLGKSEERFGQVMIVVFVLVYGRWWVVNWKYGYSFSKGI